MSEKACEKEMEDCKLDSRSQIYRPVFILAVRQEPPSITLRLGNVAGQLIQNNSFNRIFFFFYSFGRAARCDGKLRNDQATRAQ